MSYGTLYPTVTKTATTPGAAGIDVPMTEWGPAGGVDKLVAAIIVNSMATAGGNTKALLIIQTAETRVDVPDAWAVVTVASPFYVIGAGRDTSAVLDISSATLGKAWVRYGIRFSIDTGGTAPGTAELSLTCVTYSQGQSVGSWRGQLSTSITGDSVVAVTGWVPALWADAVIAALIVASASATFRCRLVHRVAEVSREAPGAWTNITSETDITGNSERCEQRSLSLATNMWVQFGLAYSSTTAGTASVADLMVSTAVRKV